MRLVFIMDPVSTVIVDEDTTFALMLEAQARGHDVHHCMAGDVGIVDDQVVAKIRKASLSRDAEEPVTLGDPETVHLVDVDVVFIRKDPPFNEDYWWLSLVLEKLRGKTIVVNDPRGLREANEKLYALNFPSVIPKSVITADKAQTRAFVTDAGGRAVIKPIDGHGGEGVFLLDANDPNLNGLIEAVTLGGKRIAMVQAFIPEVKQGDKRILLVDGELLGAILRVPQGGDVRSNIHVGGAVVKAEITDNDRRIIDTVRDRLLADGLFFVGLDVIGDYLTEVNVTSPTGIQQMSRLDGVNYEAVVIERLEKKAAPAVSLDAARSAPGHVRRPRPAVSLDAARLCAACFSR